MIVNSDNNRDNMSKDQVSQDNPPSYDAVESMKQFTDVSDKPQPQPQPIPVMTGGPSYVPKPSGPPTVYNYVNPQTGEHVVSLLPPDRPEMVCLQAGEHVRDTQYGILGILAAIFWFPLGIGLCLLDRRVRCQRCGLIIEDGICR